VSALSKNVTSSPSAGEAGKVKVIVFDVVSTNIFSPPKTLSVAAVTVLHVLPPTLPPPAIVYQSVPFVARIASCITPRVCLFS
jgi:hypothetical protein